MRFFVPAANTDRVGKQQPAENPVFVPPPGQKKYQNPKLYTKISETGIHPQGLKPASGIFGKGSGCRLCKASASPAQTAKRDKPANRPACGIDKALFFCRIRSGSRSAAPLKREGIFRIYPYGTKTRCSQKESPAADRKKRKSTPCARPQQRTARNCFALQRDPKQNTINPNLYTIKPESVYRKTRNCIPIILRPNHKNSRRRQI